MFVACAEGSADVQGFYALCVSTLGAKTLPGFGQRPIPAVYLAMIGVAEGLKGRGLGTALMVDAFERCLAVADNAGAYCLWLDAVDEPTARFYQKLGFSRFTAGELRMYIATQTIRDAFYEPGPTAGQA